MHCLARFGVLKTTMDDIARVVGLKKAALYYYYKNKETIFNDALEREAIRYYNLVEKKITPEMSVTAKLITSVKTYYEYFAHRADILELNTQAMVDNHALIQSIYQRRCYENRSFFAQLLNEGVESGEFRQLDVERAAKALLLVLETHSVEKGYQTSKGQQKGPNYKKLKTDSMFLLDIFINGLKK